MSWKTMGIKSSMLKHLERLWAEWPYLLKTPELLQRERAMRNNLNGRITGRRKSPQSPRDDHRWALWMAWTLNPENTRWLRDRAGDTLIYLMRLNVYHSNMFRTIDAGLLQQTINPQHSTLCRDMTMAGKNTDELWFGKYAARADERALWGRLQAGDWLPGNHPYVRGVVHDLGIPEKRAVAICEKWSQRGWYDWGINVLAGWLTELGRNPHPSTFNPLWRIDDGRSARLGAVQSERDDVGQTDRSGT